MNNMSGRATAGREKHKVNILSKWKEEEVIAEFRMSKQEIKYVCSLVKDDMASLGSRSNDVTLEEKVLVCLKTLGSGSFQNCSKDFVQVSQPTVSKILTAFTKSMVKLAPKFIFMPKERGDIIETKQNFYQFAGFPGVIGCIDGTHIPIVAPHDDEFAYVNRKKFHSINVQAICDANLVFMDVVAKWPGSNHDSFILLTSAIHDEFERGKFGDSWLLGDSGYPLKQWLITSIPAPSTPAERKFNVLHRKTRCLVERAFGVLKSRWRIMDHTGGSLCYSPAKAAKITVTCCVLHNICRRHGTPILGSQPLASPLNVEDEDHGANNVPSGWRQRQRIVQML